MMTDTTDSSTQTDPGQDPTFRENLRRQLQAKGADGTKDQMDSYVPMVQMDPAEGRALRWFGGVIGSALFLFGAFWFMAILGFPVPWYAIFPAILMFVGGFFVTAAIATRRVLKRRGW
jgi:hypothetical protein